jgi:glycosyltransferase involved in cell wall biosynthesis
MTKRPLVFMPGCGLGRIARGYAEAAAQGLPRLVHDSPTSRFPLGAYGEFADFSRAGALAERIPALLERARDPAEREGRARATARRFSWRQLAPAYSDMFTRQGGRMSP